MVDCLKVRGDGGLGRLMGGGGKAKAAAKKSGDAAAKQLASDLDIDAFGKSFGRFAGSDDVMDAQEFERFSKEINMTRQQATQLWRILDKDGSGQISKDEFGEALTGMHRARAWLRYCPDCIYQNTCAYCLETNSNCPNCNENAYCAACWADHPARHRDDEAAADGGVAAARALSTSDMIRTQLVIRPLNWAYTSPMMAWLPTAQKATLRQTLRAQQQVIAESFERAKKEEEAALALRG